MVMPRRATTSGLGLAALIAICLGERHGLAQQQGQKAKKAWSSEYINAMADLDAFNKKKETWANLREELEDFKTNMNEALLSENFEEAKKLRQQMKVINKKLGSLALQKN
mmetsp:Transcript_53748/g.149503  ORF Transcript_53748/g.149503 Transcript_53748/m.149503 type:complete len:110 (+) Transcript_53748:94-423(+)